MTRKDYVMIAEILKNNYEEITGELVDDFVKMLKSDNPNFDANRFRSAVSGNN